MHHVDIAQADETGQIEHLIHQSAQVRVTSQRLEPGRKPWIDRDEGDFIAGVCQLRPQRRRLDSLAAENVQARGH